MTGIRLLSAICLIGIVAACGKDKGEGTAQPGSSITFSPSDTSSAVAVTIPTGTVVQPFTITVRNSAGAPMKRVKVDIFQDVGTLQDQDFVLQTAIPYQPLTDDFGNVRIYVSYPAGGGLDYTGAVEAFSGTAYNNASVTVTCLDSGATTCP